MLLTEQKKVLTERPMSQPHIDGILRNNYARNIFEKHGRRRAACRHRVCDLRTGPEMVVAGTLNADLSTSRMGWSLTRPGHSEEHASMTVHGAYGSYHDIYSEIPRIQYPVAVGADIGVCDPSQTRIPAYSLCEAEAANTQWSPNRSYAETGTEYDRLVRMMAVHACV